MKSDSDIKVDVIRELEWDPQVSDPEAIGVAVEDGAVTRECADLQRDAGGSPRGLARVWRQGHCR